MPEPRRRSRSKPSRRLAAGLALLAAGLLALAIGGFFSRLAGPASGADPEIRLIRVDGVIDPVMSGYVTRGIDEAQRDHARAVILELDTPGGLDQPMRDIIKKMTGSPLPVVAYVAPSGARAASAGTYIMMAADVAAMAPGTNLGAATPVATGVDPSSTEGRKIINDAAAYIRSLAQANGRNANWAELAVRQSVSLSDDEALRQQVIDMKAGNLTTLLKQINGFHTRAKNIDINTGGATVVEAQMTLEEEFLELILNPDIAYLLLLIGLLALAYEFIHPGIGAGAVTGVICLVLAAYALYMLPVNLTGVILVVAGVVMLGADLFVTSHGALSAGGIIAVILGSFFLFNVPFLEVSWPLNLALAALVAVFFLLIARKVIRARRMPSRTGEQAMVGEVGHARSRLDPLGQVFVHGEIWSAEAPEGEIIEKGEEIEVTGVRGLMLSVRRSDSGEGLLPP